MNYPQLSRGTAFGPPSRSSHHPQEVSNTLDEFRHGGHIREIVRFCFNSVNGPESINSHNRPDTHSFVARWPAVQRSYQALSECSAIPRQPIAHQNEPKTCQNEHDLDPQVHQ